MSHPGPCSQFPNGPPSNRVRYVVNVPCNSINPTLTGVRRKLIFEDDPGTRRESHPTSQAAGYTSQAAGYTSQAAGYPNQSTQQYDDEDFEEEAFERTSSYYNPNFQPEGNLERLRNLIDEENKRVISSEKLARSIGGSLRRPKTYKEATSGIRREAKMDLDVDSDIEANIPAAILEAEEQGIPLGQTPPSRFYGRLFPEDKERPTVQVLGASRQKGYKVMPKMTGIWRDKDLGYDLDAGIIDFYGMKKPKKPQESPKPAAHVPGENINELFGISTSEVMDEKEKSFKYIVNREGKHRGNYFQLRGSNNPSWFPGYMHVLPEQQTVQYSEEPFGVLDKAWRSLSPSDVDSPHGNFIVGT